MSLSLETAFAHAAIWNTEQKKKMPEFQERIERFFQTRSGEFLARWSRGKGARACRIEVRKKREEGVPEQHLLRKLDTD